MNELNSLVSVAILSSTSSATESEVRLFLITCNTREREPAISASRHFVRNFVSPGKVTTNVVPTSPATGRHKTGCDEECKMAWTIPES